MARYSIGNKVILDNSNKEGVIIEIFPARRGRQLYKVSFQSGIEDILETDLTPVYDVSDPYERCKSGIFGSYSDYSQINTTFKIRNSSNNTLSSLKASKTIFKPYQFKPLLKLLNSSNRRLLVADEVGLGKTIEAGHIMLELKARNELHNVLIICPKSLRDKWKSELSEKFGLQFKIYDTSKELIQDMKDQVSDIHAIINYEKIRAKKKKKEYSEKDRQKSSHKQTENLAEYIESYPRRFSLILCDESHKMRNRETQTYQGAEMIMPQADAAVFLTATPVMISTENLYNQLHLLDPIRYFDYQIFNNRLEENKPIIEAISQVNALKPFIPIKEELENKVVHTRFLSDHKEIYSRETTIAESFKDDPRYKEIIRLLGQEESTSNRARIQYLLSSLSVMNMVFSRTRKREVWTDMSQAERKPHRCDIVLTQEEQREFDSVIEEYYEDNAAYDNWGEESFSSGANLGLIQKKRQIASSVYSYLNTDKNLDLGIDAYADKEDSKVNELEHIIHEVFDSGTKKLVIFAIFRKTLKYLAIRLKKKGYKCVVIHGMVDDRTTILSQFKNDPSIQILLSSEVGSEGLDLQFCNSMVNYDLPWNPMVVEQRIGRIDRFGQKAEIVNIYNLVVSGSIQEEIYTRLLERIGIFKGTIGDMEAILDAPICPGSNLTILDAYQQMERDFFTKHLTEEERNKKMAEIQQAYANEKENLEHLKEGLSNTLTNDAYFREEVNRILKKRAYVTEEELRNYLQTAIRLKMTTCSLDDIGSGKYLFRISPSQPKALTNFLTQYLPNNYDSNIAYDSFRRKIRDKESFELTFNQQVAYEEPDMVYINIYHPIIQACLNYFVSNEDKTKTSFCYSLDSDELLKSGSRYYMATYQLTTSLSIQGINKKSVELLPILFDYNHKEVITDETLIDQIFAKTQTQGKDRNVQNEDVHPSIIDEMRYDFAEHVRDVIKQRIDDAIMQWESDRRRNEAQAIEYYNSRLENYDKRIRELEFEKNWTDKESERNVISNRIRFTRDRRAEFEEKQKGLMDMLKSSSSPSIEEKLVSINLITIV